MIDGSEIEKAGDGVAWFAPWNVTRGTRETNEENDERRKRKTNFDGDG